MQFKHKALALLLGAAVMVAAGCGQSAEKKEAGTVDKSQTITVSAAASMQAAMNELKDNYVKAHHLDASQIAINYGGSGTLRQQIEQGAPASIFVSADEKNMKMLQDKQLVSQVKPLTANSLVLIVPKGKPAIKIDQLANVNRIAIGTVETVPAGRYAQQTLTKLGMWDLLQSKIVYAKDVKAVAAYTAEGSVDAGFVYKTDALDLKDKVVIADTAPADAHSPIIYPIAMVTKNENQLTKDFYAYLTSSEAQQILQKYGFTSVPNTAK